MNIYAALEKCSTPHEMAAYMCIAKHADNSTGEAWPSVAKIAGWCHMSQGTARKAIKGLVRAGLVRVESRHRDDGSSSSNLYRLETLQEVKGVPHQMKSPLQEMKGGTSGGEGETLQEVRGGTSGGEGQELYPMNYNQYELNPMNYNAVADVVSSKLKDIWPRERWDGDVTSVRLDLEARLPQIAAYAETDDVAGWLEAKAREYLGSVSQPRYVKRFGKWLGGEGWKLAYAPARPERPAPRGNAARAVELARQMIAEEDAKEQSGDMPRYDRIGE